MTKEKNEFEEMKTEVFNRKLLIYFLLRHSLKIIHHRRRFEFHFRFTIRRYSLGTCNLTKRQETERASNSTESRMIYDEQKNPSYNFRWFFSCFLFFLLSKFVSSSINSLTIPFGSFFCLIFHHRLGPNKCRSIIWSISNDLMLRSALIPLH